MFKTVNLRLAKKGGISGKTYLMTIATLSPFLTPLVNNNAAIPSDCL